MFRSIFDLPEGDIFFFTSVTKDKIIWFVVACLLYLLCYVLLQYSNNQAREGTQQHQYKAQQI